MIETRADLVAARHNQPESRLCYAVPDSIALLYAEYAWCRRMDSGQVVDMVGRLDAGITECKGKLRNAHVIGVVARDRRRVPPSPCFIEPGAGAAETT